MTAKEIFESIDLSQLPKDAADKFRKVEKATKGFTIESEKVNTFMRGAYKKIKETKPTALKNLKVEEKITKKEVKKGKTTEVVENLEYKVKGTKKVSKKTPTPSKPKRSGETAMERARKIRKKGEAWKDALARAQKELKAEATKAKKDAEKVVSTTSQALKNLEKMIQNDPKLKGYPRTYGKQSKRIDANKDAKIKAKPAGKRVSKKGHKNQYGESKGGRVYWENRDNRSDRYAPNFPNKVYLEMGGETDDLGFPTGHTFLVVEVSPDGTKNLIKSTKDYMTALMSSAVARGMKSNKDARVVIVDKEDKKVIHEAFEAGGEITITPTQLINNPDALVGTTTMTELFECGGVTAYQEGGEVFVTPNPLLNAGSGDYVAGSNTMSNMFAKGGEVKFERDNYGYSARVPYKGEYFLVEMGDNWNAPKDEVFITDRSFRTIDNNSQTFSNIYLKMLKAKKDAKVPEYAKGGFIAMYDGKRAEIDADTLLEAKKKAIQELKVPKSKQGLLSVMANQAMANEDFRFMAKGGNLKRFDDKIADLSDDLEDNKETIEETQEFLRDIYGKDMTYQDRLEYKYAKGGVTPKAHIQKLANDLWDRKGYDLAYLEKLSEKELKSLWDTEFFYEDEFFEKGGRLGFEGLAKKVAKRYEGKAVKPKYQEEYGKTYSKEEAMEVGRKVAAKVYGQQQANMKKMAKGGYLVRFEDEGKYETQKFATLDKAKDFYSFISEQKMNYGPQKTQLISNEDGKVLMGAKDLPQLAKGGSLDGHGLQLGDKIVEDLGSVLKVTTKDGGMVYVDLASGYRGKDMPLPFEKGGAVGGIKIPDIAKKFGKTTADVMKQVEIGAKHEMEHTSDAKKARKIALDHLSGDLDYYTKLKKLGL